MDSGKQIAIWFIPCTLLVCTYLQPSTYSFVGQFSLRAHNSSHLYFSAPISCFMPIVKNLWDIPYYTMLYLLSRYHCLDYPTYCAFVIQINCSEVFSIAKLWYTWISIFSSNTWDDIIGAWAEMEQNRIRGEGGLKKPKKIGHHLSMYDP